MNDLIPPLVSDGQILAEVNGCLGLITLNRPQALNALSLAMIRDLFPKDRNSIVTASANATSQAPAPAPTPAPAPAPKPTPAPAPAPAPAPGAAPAPQGGM